MLLVPEHECPTRRGTFHSNHHHPHTSSLRSPQVHQNVCAGRSRRDAESGFQGPDLRDLPETVQQHAGGRRSAAGIAPLARPPLTLPRLPVCRV